MACNYNYRGRCDDNRWSCGSCVGGNEPRRYVGTSRLLPSERAVFPYRSYWRGYPYDDCAYVDGRRAGYRPRVDITRTLPPYTKQFRFPDNCWSYQNVDYPCGRGNYRSQVFRVAGNDFDPYDLSLSTLGTRDEREFF